MKYLKSLLGIILLVFLLALLLFLISSCLIGMGYLVDKLYHIELFQSIIIVSIASIGLMLFWIKFSVEKIEQYLKERDNYYYDDEEDIEVDDVICPECGEKMMESENPTHKYDDLQNNTKVGRNNPCPCGSGKKYKKCCGKRKSTYPLIT
jgi:energy-coupling factor transporter transmembrane protein EcfT